MHSIEEWEGNNDKVFFYILEKATPEVQDAILVLMAYYFETCDLFETPTKGGNP